MERQPLLQYCIIRAIEINITAIKNGEDAFRRLTANQTRTTTIIIRSNKMIHKEKVAIPTHFLIWHSSGQVRFCCQRATRHLRGKIAAEQKLNLIQSHHQLKLTPQKGPCSTNWASWGTNPHTILRRAKAGLQTAIINQTTQVSSK